VHPSTQDYFGLSEKAKPVVDNFTSTIQRVWTIC
jgi:hypothetical protein